MATKDSHLTATFPLLGRTTAQIGQFTLDSHYLVSTDGFDFDLVSEDRSQLWGYEAQPVELAISTEHVSTAVQVVGRIDKTSKGGGPRSRKLSGRDFIADLVESRIDPTVVVTAGTSLSAAIIAVAAPCGITTLEAPGNWLARNIRTGKTPSGQGAGKDFATVTLEDCKPKAGQGSYEFLARLAARNGATIQPGAKRDTLSIQAPDYDQAPLYRLRRTVSDPRGTGNNIADAEAIRDYSSVPTYGLVEGQAGGSGSGARPASIVDVVAQAAQYGREFEAIVAAACYSGRLKAGDAGPADGRLYRFLYQRDNEARNAAQADALSKRTVSERLKDCLVYTVKLQGFEDPESKALWGVNTIVDVYDELENVFEPLWIVRRKFSYQDKQGAQTELTCWRKGAFIVGE